MCTDAIDHSSWSKVELRSQYVVISNVHFEPRIWLFIELE